MKQLLHSFVQNSLLLSTLCMNKNAANYITLKMHAIAYDCFVKFHTVLLHYHFAEKINIGKKNQTPELPTLHHD